MQQVHPFSFTFPRRFLALSLLFSSTLESPSSSAQLLLRPLSRPGSSLAFRRRRMFRSALRYLVPIALAYHCTRLMCPSPAGAAFGRFTDYSVLLTAPPPPPYIFSLHFHLA
ncbi:uncharacterized protein BDV14DRAFT_146780 [Aspergillus stella-maris]|uniref:uncharacterized protein n=1 Tax=Aspergillus stella-maris TaxID=1810926 RepID=UPI003CCDB0F6